MALALARDVTLNASRGRVILTRRGVLVEHHLAIEEALALSLLDALGDVALTEATFAASFSGADGHLWTSRVIDRYWPFLRERPVDADPAAIDLEWLRALGGTGAKYAPPPIRSAAPRALTWLVTLGCNRRCPYCYYDVFAHDASSPGAPSDATLPLDRAVAMVREMGAIGAADLYLTGGEPLLRPDLAEVIAEATAARVRTHLVTKLAITSAIAARLARAGLTRITLSLDDARPREAALHAGAQGYLDECTTAIRAAVDHGLRVDVNCVLTAINESALHLLAEHLVELGVPRLTLGRLGPPASPRRSLIKLFPDGDLETHLRRLGESFEGRLEIGTTSSIGADGDRACDARLVCDVGATALDVLPDGSVTRCRYLPGRGDLVVGSLRESTLLEIWNGGELADLMRPAERDYAGTDCHGCASFDACNDRGRCFMTALRAHERLFAPDAFCRR